MKKLIDAVKTINVSTTRAAGARYTPIVESNAPNLTIQASVEVIDALSLSTGYRKRVSALANELEKSWDEYSRELRRGFRGRVQTPLKLAELFRTLACQKPGESARTLSEIERTLKYCRKRTRSIEYSLHDSEPRTEKHDDSRRHVETELSSIRKVSSALASASQFVRSSRFQAVRNNRVLLLGDWGVGKTHFLCDLANSQGDENPPSLTVLAHKLPKTVDPLEAISDLCGFGGNVEKLLSELSTLGREKNGRFLIVFDGINEADRAIWKSAISKMADTISSYNDIALVLSCRTPFEQQIFSNANKKFFVHFYHPGFEEIEVDAQHEYFKFYKVPTPEVPLLVEEFSRPLFLKILCKTLQYLSDRSKSQRIKDLASGHKSMTKIFEDFVRQIGRNVEQAHGLTGKTCWRILKGTKDKASGNLAGVAVSMAEKQMDWLPRSDVLEIVSTVTNKNVAFSQSIMESLITEGLLAEDMVWVEEDWIDVLRLPYQRFSDHLISRHLLEKHLKADSIASIKRSFYRNRPLGKVFETDEYGSEYRMPGIASALMLEFPERIKRVAPEGERELVFYLPAAKRTVEPFVDVFLDGLIWRDSGSFSNQTHYLISFLLEHARKDTCERVLDTLVCLATRSAQSETQSRLVSYLENLTMSDRDLKWSEYVRNSSVSGTPNRTLRWIEEHQNTKQNKASQSVLVKVLEWFLTTTNRSMRDRTTRALVLIGDANPKVIFDQTLISLGRNDPYISERMLAASYGVLLRNWSGDSKILPLHASEFARSLFDKMFNRRAKFRTKHILAREYALGCIEIAKKMSPKCLQDRDEKLLQSPFSSFRGPIPKASKIEDLERKDAEYAIRMDFGNYTIGRLVDGRANYDNEHVEYKAVRKQIEWRIVDLGFEQDRFEALDRLISDESFRRGRGEEPGKIDRYGKKYSWIAYFEVAGLLQEKKVKGSVWHDERISDCDIDPSFPPSPPTWKPDLKDFFGPCSNIVDWIGGDEKPDYSHLLQTQVVDGEQGPWVLLDGFIQEQSQVDDRQVFTFLRGLFVSADETEKLKSTFEAVDYPGNHLIPESLSDYYTFGGEVPWSPRFSASLYQQSKSSWKRHTEEALSITRSKKVLKQAGDLSPFELFSYARHDAPIDLEGILARNDTTDLFVDPDEPVEVVEYHREPGITVEIPAISSSWESYHSVANPPMGWDYPAPAICDFLRLTSLNGSGNLIDQSGKYATRFVTFRCADEFSQSHLLFIRKDLLKLYLEHTNQALAWLVWGERKVNYKAHPRYEDRLQGIWGNHSHIHRDYRIAVL